jgi:LytR cell envelope-related transcriptional attenuator
MSSPSDLHKLLDVARQNVAVDSGFDLADFVQQAAGLTDRGVSLYTLPITGFSQDSVGEDVNTIDVPTVRSIVHTLVEGDLSAPTSTSKTNAPSSVDSTTIPAASGIVLNIVNASPFEGLASRLVTTFSERGFTAGEATTADSTTDESTVKYGPGGQAAAEALAHQLNLTATASATIAPDTVQLTIGSDFPSSDYLNHTGRSSTSSTTTTSPTPVATVSATATGTQAPAPTDLTRMTNDQAPCVK